MGETRQEARYRGKPYDLTDKGLLWWRPIRGSAPVPILLANFNAVIIEDLILDDGAERPRAFKIHATIGKREATITISARQFSLMNWPTEHLGARANVEPGLETRARAAIIHLSQRVIERTLYRHTGWRDIDGKPAYLHAGGAIGEKGRVKVETQLSPILKNFLLPEPRRRPEIARAVRASMAMLDVAPDRVTFPVFSAVWRAILKESMFSIHVTGPTGAGKSQVAALAQQHFGAKMNGDHLPLSWSSTANSIEAVLFEAKDTILVVDDFVPTGSANDMARLQGTAERVMRAQGNHSNRTRMTADITVRPPRPPQGVLLSTGEDTPGTQSLRARQVIIELAKNELKWEALTNCQLDAAAGRYAMAAAGFIRWVAPRIEALHEIMDKELAQFRLATAKTAEGSHRRTPDNVCSLAVGFRMWLKFARSMQAISAKSAADLWTRACKAFEDLIDHQSEHQVTADPAQQFLTLISSQLAGGRAHLANRHGGAPPSKLASGFGWRTNDGLLAPQGSRIGWTEGDNVYLAPELAFASAQELGRQIGQPITISLGTLKKRLQQSGVLQADDTREGRKTARVFLEGKYVPVMRLSTAALTGGVGGYAENRTYRTYGASGMFAVQSGWNPELDEIAPKTGHMAGDSDISDISPDISKPPESKDVKPPYVRYVRFPRNPPHPPRVTVSANGKHPAAKGQNRMSGTPKKPDIPPDISAKKPDISVFKAAAAILERYPGARPSIDRFMQMLLDRCTPETETLTDEILTDAIERAYATHRKKQTSVGLFLDTVPQILAEDDADRERSVADQLRRDTERDKAEAARCQHCTRGSGLLMPNLAREAAVAACTIDVHDAIENGSAQFCEQCENGRYWRTDIERYRADLAGPHAARLSKDSAAHRAKGAS